MESGGKQAVLLAQVSLVPSVCSSPLTLSLLVALFRLPLKVVPLLVSRGAMFWKEEPSGSGCAPPFSVSPV